MSGSKFPPSDQMPEFKVDWDKWNKQADPEIIQAMDNKIEDLTATIQAIQERLGRARGAIKEVREGNALMAEGEGDDSSIYQEMAMHLMKRCDEALKDIAD